MAKVFVSYSRKDSVVARKLIAALSSIQQDVWVDWEDIPPAVDWLEQIFRGIEGSEAFIFLISPDSIASEVCNVEVKHAVRNNKRIIPIVLRDVDPKITAEMIRRLNWTFIREQDNFDDGLAKVKIAIELDLPWVEEHNRLQARALDWDRKKEPSLLLRGRDLRNAKNMIAAATSKDPTPSDLQKTYIQQSNRSERNRFIAGIATGIAILALIFLSYRAVQESNRAQRQEKIAVTNAEAASQAQLVAEDERGKAVEALEYAKEQQRIADEQRNIAQAQRSVARALFSQSEPGGLYTSTLLAIDSWQKSPSEEAEEILRKNISLLPLPVAQASQSGKINSLEFSPDGTIFVTASEDSTACAWNVEDGKKLFCAESPGPVNDAAFNPLDGKFIVTGDESGHVQILDAENGNIQTEFEYDSPVRDVNIRSDGKLLAVARENGSITIIDLIKREESYHLQAASNINVSAFSPNGVWLAVGSKTGTVTVWNLITGETLSRPRHKGEVLAISFSPNNRYIATGGKDKKAIVVRTDTGEELLPVTNEDTVEDVAFSPDSSWFVTVSDDQRIRIWDMNSGTERLRMLQDSVVNEVEVSSNGQWIATTGSDKTVRLWNTATGAEIFQIPLKAGGSVLAFSKDGRYLVSGDQSGAIGVWNISTMAAPANYVQFNEIAGNVRFSPSGDWIVASDEKRVWLLDAKSVSNLTAPPEDGSILEFKSNVKAVIFSPDSKLLGILTDGNEVATYKIETRSLKTLKVSSPIQAIAFSPDSLQFITTDADGKVQAWNTNNSGFINSLIEEKSGVLSIAASPELLTVGLKDRITILDMNNGQALPAIELPGDHELLAFSADGSLLASSNSSGEINIWKYQNSTFTHVTDFVKEQAVSLAFNPNGTLIAVGTAKNVYLMDPATGEEIARIPHIDIVNSVSFSTDGNILATASSKALQFWDITQIQQIRENNLIETACSRLTENFSKAQWSALFGTEPYTILCPSLPVPQ